MTYLQEEETPVLTTLLFLTLGCSNKGAYDAILGLDADASVGADVYSTNCAGCHGASGEGGVGPAMSEAIGENSEESFLDVVFNGIGSEMPSFDLSDQEAADLVMYCDTTFGGFGTGEGDGDD